MPKHEADDVAANGKSPRRSTGRSQLFSDFACKTAHYAGKPLTFLIAVLVVLIWAAAGPFFGFSYTWQLVINTSTTIITFLMVFLIQNTQNRDGAAVDQNGPGRIATDGDRVVEIVTEYAQHACGGIEGRGDGHEIGSFARLRIRKA